MYKSRYETLDFERRDLFDLLSRKYQSANVLYPGCGAHITPSFYFHHVVYLDRSKEAMEFFSDRKKIESIINENRIYNQSPYFIFSNDDFKENSALFKYRFDLLISLYADDVIENCIQYLKNGGLIISNNYRNEVLKLINREDLILIGEISRDDKCYILKEKNIDVIHRDEVLIQSDLICRDSNGVKYLNNEIYYIVKKVT